MSPSDNISPGAMIEEESPIVLHERLMTLRARYEQRSITSLPPELATMPEADQAAWRYAFEEETANMVREQIGIIMKLRKTATGPAKRGGKRAKAAPADPTELMAQLMKLNE